MFVVLLITKRHKLFLDLIQKLARGMYRLGIVNRGHRPTFFNLTDRKLLTLRLHPYMMAISLVWHVTGK
jgi:hypothetical protein